MPGQPSSWDRRQYPHVADPAWCNRQCLRLEKNVECRRCCGESAQLSTLPCVLETQMRFAETGVLATYLAGISRSSHQMISPRSNVNLIKSWSPTYIEGREPFPDIQYHRVQCTGRLSGTLSWCGTRGGPCPPSPTQLSTLAFQFERLYRAWSSWALDEFRAHGGVLSYRTAPRGSTQGLYSPHLVEMR